MNHRERFKAICHFEKPDYYPIFGNQGAPGFSMGTQIPGHEKLLREGMPQWVDYDNLDLWQKYWGVTSPILLDFYPAYDGGPGIKSTTRIENGFEVIEYETGALTRQVINNDQEYSMPQFIRYDVRDRKSWEFYKEKTAHGPMWDLEKIKQACKRFENRTKPLRVYCGSTWGQLRDLAGTELASTMLYDDPELAHEIIDYFSDVQKKYVYPVIELLKPEIVSTGEDNCYKSGMLLSPKHFREFCGQFYRETADLCRSVGVDLIEVDSDGNVMEFVPELVKCGFNGLFPFECKAGNDLFKLREQFPKFIMMGWLEKEVVNDGNEHLIEGEILSKVPRLLKTGGYFPNGDHGTQPEISFKSLCKFMTILHEVTGNPEGLFPRA